MSKILKKDSSVGPLSSDPDDMTENDKLGLMKQEYNIAKSTRPNYAKDKEEIMSYFVELPARLEIKDLSKVNKLYAMAQSFSSRVTTLEVNAIDNHSRWKRLVNLMEGYIEDKEYRLLTKDDIAELTNMKAEAVVKHALAKERRTLRKLKSNLEEAYSFMLMVVTKKKDLASVLTTLGKQVRALSLDNATNPYHKGD